jgi:phosphate/sulfate permease
MEGYLQREGGMKSGCLPILVAWFLIDLIGKAIICGIAALCGKEVPGLATVVKCSASAILTPLIAIYIAIAIYWAYLIISDLVSNILHKGKKTKEIEDQRMD